MADPTQTIAVGERQEPERCGIIFKEDALGLRQNDTLKRVLFTPMTPPVTSSLGSSSRLLRRLEPQ